MIGEPDYYLDTSGLVSQMRMFRYHWRCANLGWCRMWTNLWMSILEWIHLWAHFECSLSCEHIWNAVCAQNCAQLDVSKCTQLRDTCLHLHIYLELFKTTKCAQLWASAMCVVCSCLIVGKPLDERPPPVWKNIEYVLLFLQNIPQKWDFFSPKYSDHRSNLKWGLRGRSEVGVMVQIGRSGGILKYFTYF